MKKIVTFVSILVFVALVSGGYAFFANEENPIETIISQDTIEENLTSSNSIDFKENNKDLLNNIKTTLSDFDKDSQKSSNIDSYSSIISLENTDNIFTLFYENFALNVNNNKVISIDIDGLSHNIYGVSLDNLDLEEMELLTDMMRGFSKDFGYNFSTSFYLAFAPESSDAYVQCVECGKLIAIGEVTTPISESFLCTNHCADGDAEGLIMEDYIYFYEDASNFNYTLPSTYKAPQLVPEENLEPFVCPGCIIINYDNFQNIELYDYVPETSYDDYNQESVSDYQINTEEVYESSNETSI